MIVLANVKDNTEGLTKLGTPIEYSQYNNPTKEILEVFPNQYPDSDYVVEFIFPEFTSCCPKTKQPDFGTIKVRYIPNKNCIETKSLKLYYLAYRNEGMFMETIVNKIKDDLVVACLPKHLEVVGVFNPRGGTGINIQANYINPEFAQA